MPDLAVSLPTPTDGGRTYTFRLRPEHPLLERQAVKASDFRSTFERDFKIGKFPVQYYDGIVGASSLRAEPEALRPLARASSRTTPRRPSRSISSPRPGVPGQARAALRIRRACRNADARDSRTHPAAGDGAVHDRELPAEPRAQARAQSVLPRVVEGGATGRLSGQDRLRDRRHAGQGGGRVISGKADVFSSAQSENSVAGHARRGRRSQHASQVHTNPQPATICLFLNTRVAPFNRLDVRRALNYAADRAAAVARRRRTRRRPGDVPDPASALPGLPALLPVHRGHDDATATGRRRISPRRAPSSPAPARAA